MQILNFENPRVEINLETGEVYFRNWDLCAALNRDEYLPGRFTFKHPFNGETFILEEFYDAMRKVRRWTLYVMREVKVAEVEV